jgi:hypothetical protein
MAMNAWKGLTIAALIAALAVPAGAQGPDDWQRMVAPLAPGTRLELHLADGTGVDFTLVVHDGDVLVLNPRTRVPVDPWRVAYSEIRSIDVKKGAGMSPGAKVLAGIGIGAGVVFVTFLIVLASIDD